RKCELAHHVWHQEGRRHRARVEEHVEWSPAIDAHVEERYPAEKLEGQIEGASAESGFGGGQAKRVTGANQRQWVTMVRQTVRWRWRGRCRGGTTSQDGE